MIKDFKFEREDFFSLDLTIAKILYPLLKEFKKQTLGHPGNIENKKEWDKILDKMIESFRLIIKCDGDCSSLLEKQKRKVYEGFNLFHEHYFQLWY